MIPVHGFHIEPTNICTLKCPGCSRTQFIEQWPKHWRNHSLSIDDLMRFIDIDITGIKMNFCGNYGDPIYHPNFVEMVAAVKAKGSIVTIDTNGSYKKKEWWEELCSVLDSKDQIRFGIDGSPSSFTEYRVNADWNSILVGIETCLNNKVKVVWKFIPFAFNQAEIESTRKIAQEIGVDEFLINPSDRYDQITEHLIPLENLIGPRKSAQDSVKNNVNLSVSPKCQSGSEHFITADGYYSPCCYVADHRFYYKTQFGKSKNQYSIKDRTFSEIIANGETTKFMDSISTDPHKVCQFNCPKV